MEYITITLLIFSGRPAPECTIQVTDPDFQRIKDMLPAPPGGNIVGGLGYQGYIVRDTTGTTSVNIDVPRGSNQALERELFEVCRFNPILKKYIAAFGRRGFNQEEGQGQLIKTTFTYDRKMDFITIVLLIFSGLPDPECTIPASYPNIRRITNMLPAPPGGNMVGGLGYKGYSVTITTIRADPVVSFNINVPRGSNRALERRLFKVCHFNRKLKKYIPAFGRRRKIG